MKTRRMHKSNQKREKQEFVPHLAKTKRQKLIRNQTLTMTAKSLDPVDIHVMNG